MAIPVIGPIIETVNAAAEGVITEFGYGVGHGAGANIDITVSSSDTAAIGLVQTFNDAVLAGRHDAEVGMHPTEIWVQ